MRITPLLVAVGLLAGITTVSATTASYSDKGYDFGSLKTFDFKTQRRISQDSDELLPERHAPLLENAVPTV